MSDGVRALLIMGIEKRRPSRSDMLRSIGSDEEPRVLLFEDSLHAEVLDAGSIARLPAALRALYRPLPMWARQVLEAYRRRGEFDVIVSWNDRTAILMAALLRLPGARPPFVALMMSAGGGLRSWLLKQCQGSIDKIIMWSSNQVRVAVDELGLDRSRFVLIPYQVDQEFYHPLSMPADNICAVGDSMRDYRTLIEAVRDSGIPCHIVSYTLRGTDEGAARDWRATARSGAGSLPANVTVGTATRSELRSVYASARFVVTPLLPSEADNGSTVILEAMAMGKAVIVSRTRGQVDVVEDGLTGIVVPQGNVSALRGAITYLWEHPDVAELMGRAARQRVEERFTLDRFVADVREVVGEVAANRAGSRRSLPVTAVRAGR